MLRCPLCHRVFAAHKERCPRHSTLEPVDAVRLDEALAARSTPLSIAELSSLIDALTRLDDDARLLVSPKRLWVATGAPSIALIGIDGDPLVDALDDALHDPLDAAKAPLTARRAYRLAAIAHELLANEPAFAAKNAKAVEVRKRLEAPPSLTAARADVPPALAALVAGALDRRALATLDESSFTAQLRALCASVAAPVAFAAMGAAPAMAPQAMAPQAMAPQAMAPRAMMAAPMPLAPQASAPSRGSKSALGLLLAIVALVALAAVAAVLFTSRAQQSSAPKILPHEAAHGTLASQTAPMPTQGPQQPPVAIATGATSPTPTPVAPSNTDGNSTQTGDVSSTPAPRAEPSPVGRRTQVTRRAPRVQTVARQRALPTNATRPRPGAQTLSTDESAPETPSTAPNGTVAATAPTTRRTSSARRASRESDNGEPRTVTPTATDTAASPSAASAVASTDAGAPPIEETPQTTREITGGSQDQRARSSAEQPSRASEPQRSSSPLLWAIGAMLAAAASVAIFVAIKARRLPLAPTAPSGPSIPSAGAAPAELVATRVSSADTVHATLHATLPAQDARPVDALAQTEVGAMVGAASLRSRPGDSNTRTVFQPFAIGAYECVERLGEGAMGIVYKARHEKLKRWCAVKVLVPDLAEKPDAAMQFRREAELAASVQHPNTVVVYDFGELDGGLLYLVMELLEGQSMDAVLRERRLAAAEALELTRQLCAGLDALHAAGIVHQDLKPQNVMVIDRHTATPIVKIVDFGLARLAGADPIESPSGGRRISGTPLYMAPEQARADERITASADLFSLAVVAYELLAGTAPFEVEGRTVSQVVLERASGQYHPRTISFAVGEASKARALDALFAEALAVEPERRPPSAQVFYARMQGALAA